MSIHFDDDDLPTRLQELSEEARHGLPFGLVGLDAQGRVDFYSRREREQSGLGEREITGLDFFGSVAPCMDTPRIRGRIEADHGDGGLDVEVGHTGDFADRSRVFRVRMMSRPDGGFWLAHHRD